MSTDIYEFTVIIPTYNRAEILKKCLDAVSSQTLPAHTFEIIVVDDGSTDNTKEIAAQFIETSTHDVKYLRQENSGQNTARNRAIKDSQGKILFIINDDTILAKNTLERHKKINDEFPEENVAVLGKMTISPELPRSITGKLHLDYAYEAIEGRGEHDWRSFLTCNLSVKKSFLIKYGLFEESLRYNDDLELGERLSHHGLKIIYDPGAMGYHYHYQTEADYFKLARLSGKTLAIWHRKSPHLKRELASVGYYPANPFLKRLKYLLADTIFNRGTQPLFISLARHLTSKYENLSLMLYKKIYKAIEREGIRDETRKR